MSELTRQTNITALLDLSTRSLNRLRDPKHWSRGTIVFSPVLTVGHLVDLAEDDSKMLQVGGLGRATLRNIRTVQARVARELMR